MLTLDDWNVTHDVGLLPETADAYRRQHDGSKAQKGHDAANNDWMDGALPFHTADW
ncbi:hypothetical protein J2801_002840 [Paraburkholderia phenoliruptrix]|uniref:hypothetical protein n=1 Tax=Paraburkholderia phenoliruptrix TaxID=252970 RepID=UPI002857D828|nr:hypothetical protein [Paraburkholderia phenoliruptrix]MDR6420559.1 hypothetical protein [Paraburkholderia phenoliruptrix]